YPPVGSVADLKFYGSLRLWQDLNGAEDRFSRFDAVRRNAQLRSQNATKLLEYDFADDQVVFGKHGSQDICAQTARRERSDKDIRIEADPHDRASKISSSVR